MKIALTEAQMQAIERAAIDTGSVSGLELMARAGKAAAVQILGHFTEDECRSAHVLCGPGNNGGDGFAIARNLASDGWDVRVWSLLSPEQLRGNARKMFLDWSQLGPVGQIEDFDNHEQPDSTVVVDAMFGVGLSRPIEYNSRNALAHAMRYKFLVAVDILSGVSSDTGKFMSSEPITLRPSNMTITFQCPKLGHFLGDGGWLSGKVCIVSIGLEEQVGEVLREQRCVRIVDADDIQTNLLIRKFPTQHKYDHGHVLVLSGGKGRGGAGRLAARSALRIGAGLVTLGVTTEAILENAAQLNAVMISEISNPNDLDFVLEDQRINAICAGPGLGVGEGTRELVRRLLSSRRYAVLDADALTAFEECPNELFGILHENAVLTPHLGEFRRLFPELGERLFSDSGFSSVDAVQHAATQASALVLLKGATTVIASPGLDGERWCVAAGQSAPWLATAGSGDVLSGLIAGLMARGFPPLLAARYAAWIHAEAARRFGPGLISEDISEQVPSVLGSLISN